MHLWDLQEWGPPRGYNTEPTKIIFVVAPRNVVWADEFFPWMVIQVVTGHQYLGGFIGDREVEKSWLYGNIIGWEESVETLTGVSRKHPQSTYVGLQKSLQQECASMQ